MVLQALNQYYETLCAKGILSVPGWNDSFKVTFGLDLNDDGEIIRVIDFREEVVRGKKTVIIPKLMRVPAHPTRTRGVVANFLCDNSAYMLGIDSKGRGDMALSCFAANKVLHEKLLESVNDPAAKAILAFFRTWSPEDAETHTLLSSYWETIFKGVNLIFCYDGLPTSEVEAIQDAWQQHFDTPNPFAVKGQCLITGKTGPIAPIHPMIKGVKDAQSTGAALVSFNAPAFCSYGHEQNYNAPVSERAAFAYTTALNTLLADSKHCRVVGDTTVVCWAEHGDSSYQDAYMATMFGSSDSTDLGLLTKFLTQLQNGFPLEWDGTELDENEHFYVLGLSPNAARLSVRFFYKDNFGALARNIQKHYEDLAVTIPAYDKWEYLPLWKLLLETVNEKASNKTPSPQMAGDVLRAILFGTRYPTSLINGVYLRIRADQEVTRGRVAIIKAYFSRANISLPQEVLTVSLNENCSNSAYTLGRLFYIFEYLQEEAIPGVNDSIRYKYFNSAAATPARIFPVLASKSIHHLRKLPQSSRGYFDKQIGLLMDKLEDGFPAQFSFEERGIFYKGYYDQRQARYTPKANKNMEE